MTLGYILFGIVVFSIVVWPLLTYLADGARSVRDWLKGA